MVGQLVRKQLQQLKWEMMEAMMTMITERSKWFLEVYIKYVELSIPLVKNNCGGFET